MMISALLLLLAATAAASPAGAGELFDLDRRAIWRAQDVATRTFVSSGRLIMVGSRLGDAQGLILRRYVSTRAVSVEKCLEVDREGNPIRVLAHIRDWLEQRGDAETAIADTTIRGATLLVTGRGRNRTWTFAGPAPELSSGGKHWLDANFGATAPLSILLEGMLPKRKVAIAESWHVDPLPLLERIPQYRIESVTGTGSLRAVQNGVAQVHFSFAAFSRGTAFGRDEEILPWNRGGAMRLTLEASVALEGARAVTFGRLNSSIDGEITANLPEGAMSIAVENSWAQQQTVSEGGEFPPLTREERR